MRGASPATPPPGYVRLGRLGRSFKLDGGVRLQVEAELTDDELADLLERSPRLFVTGLGDTRLRRAEVRSGALVVHLEGVRDRTAARALVNAGVWVEGSVLPEDLEERMAGPTAEESLLGLPVLIEDRTVGEVGESFLNEANPYVRVELAGGGSALVPLVAPYVELTEDGLVLTDPPPGLLE